MAQETGNPNMEHPSLISAGHGGVSFLLTEAHFKLVAEIPAAGYTTANTGVCGGKQVWVGSVVGVEDALVK